MNIKAVVVVIAASIAIIGAGVYLIGQDLFGSTPIPDAPYIESVSDFDSFVRNPYEPQFSESEIEFIVEKVDPSVFLTENELQQIIEDVCRSKDYQRAVNDLASKTNQGIGDLVEKNLAAYQKLDTWLKTECSNISEKDITGKKGTCGGASGYVRDLDEHVITFTVKTIQECHLLQECVGPEMVEEFKLNFPNLTRMYSKYGVELTPQNIQCWPGVPIEEAREFQNTAYEDFVFNGHKYSWYEFILLERYNYLLNSFVAEDQLTPYLDSFESLISPDQLSDFNKLYDECNALYREYFSIVNEYNSEIISLQEEYLESVIEKLYG